MGNQKEETRKEFSKTYVIKTDGTKEERKPKGKYFTLNELRDIVGGMVQIVPVGGKYLVCNEEGKIIGLEQNRVATSELGKYLLPGDIIAGDVLVTETKYID